MRVLPAWLMFTAMLLLGSCTRLYYYRDKVPVGAHVTKYVHFDLVNRSPASISPWFEAEMKKYCVARLARQGFVETKKDKYDYDVTVTLQVDSFRIVKGIWLGPAGQGIPQESHVKQVSATYEVNLRGTPFTYWRSRSAIYFFGTPKRDLRRSKSVARYVLKQVY